MKYLLISALLFIGTSFAATTQKTKYICSIGVEGDAVLTEEFATREECLRYCKPGLGRPAICEETGIKTPVGLEEVD